MRGGGLTRSRRGIRPTGKEGELHCSLSVFARQGSCEGHGQGTGQETVTLTAGRPRMSGPRSRAQVRAGQETGICSGPACSLGLGYLNRPVRPNRPLCSAPPWGPAGVLTCWPRLAPAPSFGLDLLLPGISMQQTDTPDASSKPTVQTGQDTPASPQPRETASSCFLPFLTLTWPRISTVLHRITWRAC